MCDHKIHETDTGSKPINFEIESVVNKVYRVVSEPKRSGHRRAPQAKAIGFLISQGKDVSTAVLRLCYGCVTAAERWCTIVRCSCCL